MERVYRTDWARTVGWLVASHEARMMLRSMSNQSKVWEVKAIKLRHTNISHTPRIHPLWLIHNRAAVNKKDAAHLDFASMTSFY